MRRVLIISFYELKAYLSLIARQLEKKYKFNVDNYPLFMYAYDKNCKLDNYSEHFSEHCKKYKPDIIIWWFTDVPLKIFNRIKKENPKTYFLTYNSEDPKNISKTYLDKCKIFDMILTPSKHNLELYKIHSNINHVCFFPFPFESLNNVQIDKINNLDTNNYKSDISFICDTLYDKRMSKYQIIPIRKLIERIIEHCTKIGKKFKLYGPEILSMIYPNHYICNPSYIQEFEIYSQTKINIQSNLYSNKNLSIHNRIFSIIGNGNILLIDNIKDYHNYFNDNVFLYDDDTLETQINHIIGLYNREPNKIKKIKNQCIEFSKNYTWTKFVDKIFICYNQDKFDKKFYNKVYGQIKKTKNLSYDNWLDSFNNGNIEIPYDFDIPNNFDMENYKLKYELDDYDDNYVYIHWFMSCGDMDYMKRNKQNTSLSGYTMNIFTMELFELFTNFNKINNEQNIDDGIKGILNCSKRNPYLSINDALQNYIDMSYCE
jgi:hypothetical protein